jgi:hypothetical protein
MATPNVNNFCTDSVDFLLTPAHRAIETMMQISRVLPEYFDMDVYLDICTDLRQSPAFHEFSKQEGVDHLAAAKLLLAGKFYLQFLEQDAEVSE